jgi:hypothetical protein
VLERILGDHRAGQARRAGIDAMLPFLMIDI